MFCIECGFKNPDRAKFCAKCGARLFVEDGVPAAPEVKNDAPETVIAETVVTEPAAVPVKKAVPAETDITIVESIADEDTAYKKPAAPGSRRARREEAERRMTVEPLLSNPAQPVKPQPADWESAQERFQKAFERPEPVKNEKPKEEPEPEEPIEDVKPAEKPHTVINSDGETVPEPKRLSAKQERRNSTYVPKRNPLTGFDAFLDDEGEDDEENDAEKESFVEKHLRSIITLILVAVALIAVIAVMASPIGKKLRYENGHQVNVSAETYVKWAEGYEQSKKYARAADAYHDALINDPDNYDYAMKLAENSILSTDYQQAYKALKMCMDLDASQKTPYSMLKEIYPNLALNEQNEADGLLDGAAHTFGDTALLP